MRAPREVAPSPAPRWQCPFRGTGSVFSCLWGWGSGWVGRKSFLSCHVSGSIQVHNLSRLE